MTNRNWQWYTHAAREGNNMTTPVEALVEKYEDMLKDAADTISNQQMLIRELKQYIDDINMPTEGE
jgi:hypothetical protein